MRLSGARRTRPRVGARRRDRPRRVPARATRPRLSTPRAVPRCADRRFPAPRAIRHRLAAAACACAWPHRVLPAPAGRLPSGRERQGTGRKSRGARASRGGRRGCSCGASGGFGYDENHRDRESAVVELGVAGFDGLRLHPALVGDALKTRLQRGDVAPELRALPLPQQRKLFRLLFLPQLGLDRLFQFGEHGADVVDFLLLAGLERVAQVAETFFGTGIDGLQDGLLLTVETDAERIEQGGSRRDRLRFVQPLLDTGDAFFAAEGLVAQVAARYRQFLVQPMVVAAGDEQP